jgi:hypothetical protein
MAGINKCNGAKSALMAINTMKKMKVISANGCHVNDWLKIINHVKAK